MSSGDSRSRDATGQGVALADVKSRAVVSRKERELFLLNGESVYASVCFRWLPGLGYFRFGALMMRGRPLSAGAISSQLGATPTAECGPCRSRHLRVRSRHFLHDFRRTVHRASQTVVGPRWQALETCLVGPIRRFGDVSVEACGALGYFRLGFSPGVAHLGLPEGSSCELVTPCIVSVSDQCFFSTLWDVVGRVIYIVVPDSVGTLAETVCSDIFHCAAVRINHPLSVNRLVRM